jgi:phosphatidylserine synthase
VERHCLQRVVSVSFESFCTMLFIVLSLYRIYLPQNKHRKKRHEWYCFIGLAAAQLTLVAIVAAFGIQFKLKVVYHVILGILLFICGGLMVASFLGFKRLTEAREIAYKMERQAECTTAVCLIQKRTFSKDHIKFIRMM